MVIFLLKQKGKRTAFEKVGLPHIFQLSNDSTVEDIFNIISSALKVPVHGISIHQETLDDEHTTCIKCRSSMPCTCKFHHSDAVPLDPHYIYPIEILHGRSDFVVSREQLNYDEKSLKTHESDFTLENLIR